METLTGVKAIDDLIRVINDSRAPAWKREAARRKFAKIKNRHDEIVKAIENSEEYPNDAIWGIVKRT